MPCQRFSLVSIHQYKKATQTVSISSNDNDNDNDEANTSFKRIGRSRALIRPVRHLSLFVGCVVCRKVAADYIYFFCLLIFCIGKRWPGELWGYQRRQTRTHTSTHTNTHTGIHTLSESLLHMDSLLLSAWKCTLVCLV